MRFHLALVALWSAFPITVSAQNLNAERLTLPIPFLKLAEDDSWTIDAKIEPSAVEPIDDGALLLLADDKTPDLLIASAQSGRIVGTLKSDALPPASQNGPKWEGMAQDRNGWFYLIGSHSGKTDEERRERSHLLRLRLGKTPSGGRLFIDEKSVSRWSIAASLERLLRQEGLDEEMVQQRKIEGLAIRDIKTTNGTERRELTIGLREPDDRVRVLAADITAPASGTADLELSKLFEFLPGDAEGSRFTLNSLHHSARLGGFLIVTATEDDNNVFHGNALWFLADAQTSNDGGMVKPKRLWVFEPAMKAEGLCELPWANRELPDGSTTLAIIFDNDSSRTHMPARFSTLILKP